MILFSNGFIDAPRHLVWEALTINILLWCLQALLALEFVGVSSAKLMGMPEMVALFTAVGLGQWFRYVTGILEVTIGIQPVRKVISELARVAKHQRML